MENERIDANGKPIDPIFAENREVIWAILDLFVAHNFTYRRSAEVLGHVSTVLETTTLKFN